MGVGTIPPIAKAIPHKMDVSGSRPYNNNRQESFRDNRPGNYRDDRDRRDTPRNFDRPSGLFQ